MSHLKVTGLFLREKEREKERERGRQAETETERDRYRDRQTERGAIVGGGWNLNVMPLTSLNA